MSEQTFIDICDCGHGIDGALEEAARYSNDVAGQEHVENLTLAVAQQLVTHGIAVPDETEFSIFVAIDGEIAPARDGHLVNDECFESLQIIGIQNDVLQQPRDKRILANTE